MASSLELAHTQLVQRASKDSWCLLWAWTRFSSDCHCLQKTHTAETVLGAGPAAAVGWKSRRDAEGAQKASWSYRQGEIFIHDTISTFISSVSLQQLHQLRCLSMTLQTQKKMPQEFLCVMEAVHRKKVTSACDNIQTQPKSPNLLTPSCLSSQVIWIITQSPLHELQEAWKLKHWSAWTQASNLETPFEIDKWKKFYCKS